MTVIRPNSVSGINSITANGGDINLFRADGTKADIPIVNNITAGVVTATTFKGAIDATTGTFSGNLGVGGVLTYEDVTNIDSVGVITARSGINLTGGSLTIPDSIIHSGDTNTKIRFPEADAVTIETNGSERLRITSGGRIELKTDGGGIKFPDAQTPSNSYTPGSTSGGGRVGISSELRYYETGTFVPNVSSTVLNSLQNPAFTDASYARRIGRYVRVGHLVFVNIEIKMASSVTYSNGSTSTAPVCITASTPFRYSYNGRYDVSGQPDKNPASIWYNGSGLTNDTLYAFVSRHFPGDTMIQITKPGSGGVDQYNATNFGEIFPANSHIAVSFTYAIDLDNADY